MMCEGCGAKWASFSTLAERKKRWCSGCGQTHADAAAAPPCTRSSVQQRRIDRWRSDLCSERQHKRQLVFSGFFVLLCSGGENPRREASSVAVATTQDTVDLIVPLTRQ